MDQASMTARVSAFARAYHAENCEVKVFDDSIAKKLLSVEEYDQIAAAMAQGAGFFLPGFQGTPQEALRLIVERQLAPSPLGRAAFAREALSTAVRQGAGQYLILGAGYDTFAYRQPEWAQGIRVIEADHPVTSADKRARLARAGIKIPANVFHVSADFTDADWPRALEALPAFNCRGKSFCSLLGLTYYLTEAAFDALLSGLAALLAPGSELALDYPAHCESDQTKRQEALARGAGETMRARYAKADMEALLKRHGFAAAEHLEPPEITARYFADYNRANPDHPMSALSGVNYCLAARR